MQLFHKFFPVVSQKELDTLSHKLNLDLKWNTRLCFDSVNKNVVTSSKAAEVLTMTMMVMITMIMVIDLITKANVF